jgi:hypothetical protein
MVAACGPAAYLPALACSADTHGIPDPDPPEPCFVGDPGHHGFRL